MPTASAHLSVALDLLDDPALAARNQLASGEPHGAFLLGNVSPDVRVISGQARAATHFYDIPLSDDRTASQALLDNYPTLAQAESLPFRQAAFVAGYMAHLIMDETWLEVVVMPHLFIDGLEWTPHHPNFRQYSLLMTYEAERGGKRVSQALVERLRAVQPHDWLPFASDADLREWRDRVVKYAMTDSGWQTAHMFADLMKGDAEEMHAVVRSEEAMQREVFSGIPREALEAFRRETHGRCLAALNEYLNVTAH